MVSVIGIPTQEHGRQMRGKHSSFPRRSMGTRALSGYLARALPALVRAAERARKIAMQTGTDLVVQENGKIRHITFADNNEVAEPCAVYKPDTNDN